MQKKEFASIEIRKQKRNKLIYNSIVEITKKYINK